MRKQKQENAISEPKHIVILCHPDLESFNGAVAHTYCNAVNARFQEATVSDLYDLNFDPVLKASEQPSDIDFVPSADVGPNWMQLAMPVSSALFIRSGSARRPRC